jgi:hypothetical protein
MNDKYLSILYHLRELGGEAHVGDVTSATGLTARDVNNALRYVEPEYVEVTGRLEPHEWDGQGDEPKILTLTPAGAEKASEYTAPEVNTFDERIDEMFETLWDQNARLERQMTALQKENKRLKRLMLEDDL